MLTKLILLFLLLIGEKHSLQNNIKDFFPFFNTKTSYRYVHGKITIPNSNCKPIQIWMLVRHGTRYPKKKHLNEFHNLSKYQDEIIKNHKNKAGYLNSKILKSLSKWKLNRNINEAMSAMLTSGAEKDIRLLATRIQNAYPELFKINSQKRKITDYIFRATNTSRTQGTLNFFLTTLLGDNKVITHMQPSKSDILLTPFKYDPEWKSGSEVNYLKYEKVNFQNSSYVKKLLHNLSNRLGYNETIKFDVINLMHKMCGFETAWYINKSSVWCKIFSINELKLMEFYNDLVAYYRVGPGRPMSSKFGCVLLKDMFQYFKNAEKGKNSPKGIFYFSHSSSIQVLLSALKIGKEPQLFATTYNEAEKRKYRTSLLVPFTTNVIATFYKCTGEKQTFKVMFHIAEKITPIVGCPKGFCDWRQLQNQFKSTLKQCST